MFSLPQQRLRFFDTLKACILLWWTKLWSVLLLSIFSGVASSWPIYLKKFINPVVNTGLFLLGGVLFTIISLVPYLSIIANFGKEIHGEKLTLSQSVAASLLRLPSALMLLIANLVILGLPVCLGMFLLMIMGWTWLMIILFILFFVFSVYLYCSFPLLVINKLSAFQALKRSFQLVNRHWWYVAGLVFIISLFTISVENIGRTVLQDMGFIIAFCLVLPLQIAASVIITQQLSLNNEN